MTGSSFVMTDELAVALGAELGTSTALDAAAMLTKMAGRIRSNRQDDLAAMTAEQRKKKMYHKCKHCKAGRWWMWATLDNWTELLPWMSTQRVRTISDKLIKNGWVETGVYNAAGYDRTKWYALTEKALMFVSIKSAQEVHADAMGAVVKGNIMGGRGQEKASDKDLQRRAIEILRDLGVIDGSGFISVSTYEENFHRIPAELKPITNKLIY